MWINRKVSDTLLPRVPIGEEDDEENNKGGEQDVDKMYPAQFYVSFFQKIFQPVKTLPDNQIRKNDYKKPSSKKYLPHGLILPKST
jgi:hypothetical protein